MGTELHFPRSPYGRPSEPHWERVVQGRKDPWRIEKYIRQSTAETVHFFVEEVTQLGVCHLLKIYRSPPCYCGVRLAALPLELSRVV